MIELKFKPDELHALAGGQVIVRGLSAENSKGLAAFGAVVADATPNAFIESYRTLAIFDHNPHVLASGRLSATPSLEDFKGLVLDNDDLYALAKCRLQESDMKLSEQDIARFQSIVDSASRLTPALKARLLAEYKKLLVERARTYLAKGSPALGAFADKQEAVEVHESFVSLAREQSASARHCDHLYSQLVEYPAGSAPDSESFIYWAKQKFGSLKPVIHLVHVLIHREGSRVFIASKQIYSSHYTEAGLSVAELTPFTDNKGQFHTLILYWIRLQVDMLGGTLGFMKKRMVQPRMRRTLKESLNKVRLAMEEPGSVSAN
ncbi:MAG TPA: hypothetical protein VNO14_13940 [Blastocatellia bacterium]|nr:hypothetical protein [Blastocatellia bacterium]